MSEHKVKSGDWEMLDNCGSLFRLKIPGGWLVKLDYEVCHNLPDQGLNSGWDWRPAITFVPDPEHKWDGCAL